MPHTAPNPAEVKARYPELFDVPDARVALVIDEAGGQVDTSWTERDYKPAIMALTAHMLVSEGALDGGASAGRGALISDKLGDATQTYEARAARSQATGSDAELASTVYGQRFLALRRANRAGVRVV